MLLASWLDSLKVFCYKQFFYRSVKNFLKATKVFLKYWFWLFLVEAFLFFFVSEQTIVPVQYIFRIFWVAASCCFLLCIRDSFSFSFFYFLDTAFFRLIKFGFIFWLIDIFPGAVINVLKSKGFSLATLFVACSLIFLELISFFYYFDSKSRFRDFFISLGKSIRFIFYNLPFFLLISFVAFELVVATFYCGYKGFFMNSLGLNFKGAINCLHIKPFSVLLKITLLSLEYLGFFLKFLLVGMVFIFYLIKKNNGKTKDFFQTKTNVDKE